MIRYVTGKSTKKNFYFQHPENIVLRFQTKYLHFCSEVYTFFKVRVLPTLFHHRAIRQPEHFLPRRKRMILVVGSTGWLGGEICRRLRSQNRVVRGLVRSSSDRRRVNALNNIGVETVIGDLTDHESIRKAVDGASTVIATATSIISQQPQDTFENVDTEGYFNLIGAASAAGITRFVYVSIYKSEVDSPILEAKRRVGKRLKESSLTYSVLQPTNFMEIWLSPLTGFDYKNRKATIFGSGKNRVSWISVSNVAEFAVASVDSPTAANSVLELGGPEALSPLEVVQIFEHEVGSKFELQFVPEEALAARIAAATDSRHKTLAALSLSLAKGSVIDMSDILSKMPVRLTSVADYARNVLALD